MEDNTFGQDMTREELIGFISLQAENAKLRLSENAKLRTELSEALNGGSLWIKRWDTARKKYERLRDAISARFEPVGTVQPTVVSKDDLERIIDALEKEGE